MNTIARGAPVGLPTFQQIIKLAKSLALLSAAWTVLCAALIAARQVISWIRSGAWDGYGLASVIKTLTGEPVATYVTASADAPKPDPTYLQAIGNRLLDLPVVFFLLFIAAVIAAFYWWLVTVEKDMARE